MVTIRENTINMKALVIIALIFFALLVVTELHRVNFIKSCHDRGENTFATTRGYFLNECGYNDLDTGKYVRLG